MLDRILKSPKTDIMNKPVKHLMKNVFLPLVHLVWERGGEKNHRPEKVHDGDEKRGERELEKNFYYPKKTKLTRVLG